MAELSSVLLLGGCCVNLSNFRQSVRSVQILGCRAEWPRGIGGVNTRTFRQNYSCQCVVAEVCVWVGDTECSLSLVIVVTEHAASSGERVLECHDWPSQHTGSPVSYNLLPSGCWSEEEHFRLSLTIKLHILRLVCCSSLLGQISSVYYFLALTPGNVIPP